MKRKLEKGKMKRVMKGIGEERKRVEKVYSLWILYTSWEDRRCCNRSYCSSDGLMAPRAYSVISVGNS